MTGDDIEWLEDEVEDAQPDEVLAAGTSRPPLRRRTRIALGALAAAALGTAATVAIVSGTGDTTASTAAATSTAVPSLGSERTLANELPIAVPKAALAAIRGAFPRSELTGFSAALAAGTERDVFKFYNVTSGLRMITITVGPPRSGEADAVLRTANSLEFAQPLGRQRVRIQLRVTRGGLTARDFAAVQRLVQDPRLLAAA